MTILRLAYPTASRRPGAKHCRFVKDAPGLCHHATRPRGCDFSVDAVHSKSMESRTGSLESMHSVRQILIASIIWPCRGGKANVWLGRVPCTWPAAEALQILHESGAL